MSRSATPARSKAGWEHFPHDADVGVRGPDATTAEAFEQAAHALTAVITHADVPTQNSEC
jgi:protein archease